MIFVATVVFGFVALGRLDLRLLPELSYPALTIQTTYPDAAPAEVENFVTRQLEEAVGVVNGLRSMRSVSKPGMSIITLEFSWKTKMQYAALDVVHLIELEIELSKRLSTLDRVAWAAADNGVQIHGGNGFALEYPISRLLCDARILNIFEGAAEIQAQVIARRVLEGN